MHTWLRSKLPVSGVGKYVDLFSRRVASCACYTYLQLKEDKEASRLLSLYIVSIQGVPFSLEYDIALFVCFSVFITFFCKKKKKKGI